jgi:hypothetical protein
VPGLDDLPRFTRSEAIIIDIDVEQKDMDIEVFSEKLMV